MFVLFQKLHFEHMTDKMFQVTALPPSETRRLAPTGAKVGEVLKLH